MRVQGNAERACEMLLGTGTHKTEFKSPAPPNELSFSKDAANEIRCMLALVSLVGAAASSIHRTHAMPRVVPEGSACDSGSAVHVPIEKELAVESASSARQRPHFCGFRGGDE